MSTSGHSSNPGSEPGASPPGRPRPALAADAPIALVGMMGAGKTVVGGALSAILGRRFADTDLLIADLTGQTVSELFAKEGEAGFRARERALAADLGRYRGHVLALGGGMFVGEENVMNIRRVALTIWLRAEVATLSARLGREGMAARPLLAGEAPAARLADLLAVRSPWYAQAHLAFPTDGRTPGEVAQMIAAALACE
jgi:shikimate kinase